jgi:sodium-dependent dicarboxylate transporter 2/3/5
MIKFSKQRLTGFYLGPLIGLLAWRLGVHFLSPEAAMVLGVAANMIYWWVSGAVPIPVVALLPLVLFPTLGIMSPGMASSPYGNTVVFLFLGGFLLGAALEKWNLHKRIALNILLITGVSPEKVILGFSITSALLSMWISNTATAMMMWPVALSVIGLYARLGNKNLGGFVKTLLLAIAYSCSIGGMATLIGTPPNVVLRGYLQSQYNITLGFMEWMAFALPISIVLLVAMYFYLIKRFSNTEVPVGNIQFGIQEELKSMGPISLPEKRVLIVFLFTAAAWIFRPLLGSITGIPLDDTAIAVAGAVSLFIVPSGGTEKRKPLLIWEDSRNVSWGIILLFGGGLSLASAMEQVGLVQLAGTFVSESIGPFPFLVLIVLSLLALFLTEVMSNVALVSIFVPVVCGIATASGASPLLYAIPVTLASSCAFMLPTATPPNSVVFASGELKVSDMIRAGFWLNLFSALLIVTFSYYFIPLFFSQ